MKNIISLGAGVQSTALVLMAAHGEIGPMPDAAIFADTQGEPEAVYSHLRWLQSGVLPFPVHVVTKGDLWASATTVKRTRDGMRTYIKTPLPVYTIGEDEARGMGRRNCTRDFKIDPINREVRRLLGRPRGVPTSEGVLVSMWIGISTDEAMRMKPNPKPYITSRWPLIEQGISRQDCLAWMANKGYPMPPRSACTYCPYHSDAEWLRLTPAELADAVEKEKEMQRAYSDASAVTSKPFLHSSRVPLGEVVFKPEATSPVNLFINDCEGMCGV